MAMQVQAGREGIAPNHPQTSARKGSVVSTTLRPLYPLERLGTHCTRGGWVSLGASLDGT
jgi:hypothetical protein